MTSLSIVFRKDKLNKRGEAPIHFRIIKDRKPRYISSGQMLSLELWDFKKNKVKGKHPNSSRLNALLNKKFVEFQDILLEQESNHKSLTSLELRERLFGKKPSNFVTFAEEINADYLKDGKIGTHDKNASIIKKLKKYTNARSVSFQDITPEFLSKYEQYLRDELGNKTNTIHKDFKFIRKLFNDAHRKGLIDYEAIPFTKMKLKTEKTEIDYLTEVELQDIETLNLSLGTRLDLHRDMFVFSSYTGLRISDVLKLKWKNFDGERLHFITQKTDTQLSPKVPNKAGEIILKYGPGNRDTDSFIFPQLQDNLNVQLPRELDTAISRSTAYINKNLKILAEKAGIDKNLHFNVSRHTFATRALLKGMPLQVLSTIMGHTNITQTMKYAKIVGIQIDQAMAIFND